MSCHVSVPQDQLCRTMSNAIPFLTSSQLGSFIILRNVGKWAAQCDIVFADVWICLVHGPKSRESLPRALESSQS